MSDNILILKNFVTGNGSPCWSDLRTAIFSVIGSHASFDAEAILYQILISKNTVTDCDGQEYPGVMSPEDMLKSLAIQGLFKWNKMPSNLELGKIKETVRSFVCLSIINSLVKKSNE